MDLNLKFIGTDKIRQCLQYFSIFWNEHFKYNLTNGKDELLRKKRGSETSWVGKVQKIPSSELSSEKVAKYPGAKPQGSEMSVNPCKLPCLGCYLRCVCVCVF